MNGSFFLGLLNAAAFMLCVSFVAYVTMIVLPLMRHRPEIRGDGNQFGWHFIVPCLNEEAVIAGTVQQLVRTFPGAHIWCVDDGSTDATAKVLAHMTRRYRRVHVVTRRLPEARKGKGPALNAAWEAITRSLAPDANPERIVVGVVDADSKVDPSALDVIAGPAFFGDPHVGAVQIQVRVSTGLRSTRRRHRLLVNLQDLEFTGPIAAMQLLRRRSGSVGMGGNGQFTRLSVLNRIADGYGTPWHGALLEDFELGLHILLAGSRTEYCHDTYVEQEGLTRLRLLVRQRSRWAQGSMQCMRYLNPVLRSARISTPGALEIAYFLLIPWSQLVGGLVYIGSTLLMIYYGVSQPGGFVNWLSDGAWGVLPLFVLFGLAPLAVWGPIYRARIHPQTTRRRAMALGLANWVYSYMHYVAVWWALIRMIRSRSDWKKTAHVAAGSPLALPARSDLTFSGRLKPRQTGTARVVSARLCARPVVLLEAGGATVVSPAVSFGLDGQAGELVGLVGSNNAAQHAGDGRDGSDCGPAVPVGVGPDLGQHRTIAWSHHGEQLGRPPLDPVRVGSHDFDQPGGQGFGSFGHLAQHEDRHPQARSLLLDPAAVGEHQDRAGQGQSEGPVVEWLHDPDVFPAAQRFQRRTHSRVGVRGEDDGDLWMPPGDGSDGAGDAAEGSTPRLATVHGHEYQRASGS